MMLITLPSSVELITKSGITKIERSNGAVILNGNGKEESIISNTPVDKVKFYNLVLKNGSTLSLGEGTLVATTDGLKKIEEIKEDDFILHRFHQLAPDSGGKEINWEQVLGANANPIKLPKKMTKDLALWLGMISAKGRYYEANGYVGVSLNDKIIGKLLHELTFKLFKIKPVIYEDKKTGYLQHYIISRSLVRFLKNTLGVNSNLKKVPPQLLDGSMEEQKYFLQGLTLDGYIEQDCLVVYGGVSKRLADYTAMVLRNFGHAVYQQVRKSGQGNSVYYTKITGSHKDAVDVNALEIDKTEGIDKGGYLVKVTPEILNTKVSSTHPSYSAHRNLKQRKSKTCFNYTLDELEIEYPHYDYYVMVKEVTSEVKAGFSLKTSNQGLIYQGCVLGCEEDSSVDKTTD